MDTVLSLGVKTNYGGLYFEGPSKGRNDYSFVGNHDYHTTIETYHMLKSLGNAFQPQLDSIKQYLIQAYQNDRWLNTYFKANVIKILSDDDLFTIPDSYARITINGEHLAARDTIIHDLASGIFELRIENSKFTFITYYQEFQNKAPEEKKDYFEIEQYIPNTSKAGNDINYQIKIYSPQDAGQVILQIPVSCSFTFKDKPQFRQATHTEYNADGVLVYLDKIKRGTLEFNLNLIPQFKGDFTLNPIQIYSMYFPQISGHTASKTINID
jgi:hypothetical protein